MDQRLQLYTTATGLSKELCCTVLVQLYSNKIWNPTRSKEDLHWNRIGSSKVFRTCMPHSIAWRASWLNDSYLTALSKLAKSCEYGEVAGEMIGDQSV